MCLITSFRTSWWILWQAQVQRVLCSGNRQEGGCWRKPRTQSWHLTLHGEQGPSFWEADLCSPQVLFHSGLLRLEARPLAAQLSLYLGESRLCLPVSVGRKEVLTRGNDKLVALCMEREWGSMPGLSALSHRAEESRGGWKIPSSTYLRVLFFWPLPIY